MDRISEKILEIVRKHNEADEKIYWTKLKGILADTCCELTVQKKIDYLVKEGELISVASTVGRGIRKDLYIPELAETDDLVPMIRSVLKKVDEIKRMLER